jgi:hypothetical protein
MVSKTGVAKPGVPVNSFWQAQRIIHKTGPENN